MNISAAASVLIFVNRGQGCRKMQNPKAHIKPGTWLGLLLNVGTFLDTFLEKLVSAVRIDWQDYRIHPLGHGFEDEGRKYSLRSSNL